MSKLLPLLLVPMFAQADIGSIQYQQLYLAEKAKQQYYQKQLDFIQTIDYKDKTQEFLSTNEWNRAFNGDVSRSHYNLTNSRYNYLFNQFPLLRERIIDTSNANKISNAQVTALVNTIRNLSTYINNEVDYTNSSVEYFRYTYPKTPTVVDNIHTKFSYSDDKTVIPSTYRVNHFFNNIWLQRVKVNGTPVSEINFTVFKEEN